MSRHHHPHHHGHSSGPCNILGADGKTSWAALDNNGHVIPGLSHKADLRQDNASTTKIALGDTIGTMSSIATMRRQIAANPEFRSFMDHHPNLRADLTKNPALAQDATLKRMEAAIPNFLQLTHLAQNTPFGHYNLPEDFFVHHQQDLSRMMNYSDNVAAVRVAQAATGVPESKLMRRDFESRHSTPGHHWYMSSESAKVPAATDLMNVLAREKGYAHIIPAGQPHAGEWSTHFVTVNGMPDELHYSNAADMAKMIYAYNRSFGGRGIEGHDRGMMDYAMVSATAPELIGAHKVCVDGKTGTARGYHGGEGKSSFAGAFHEGGFIAVAGADNEVSRAAIVERLAPSISLYSQHPALAQLLLPQHGDSGTIPDPSVAHTLLAAYRAPQDRHPVSSHALVAGLQPHHTPGSPNTGPRIA